MNGEQRHTLISNIKKLSVVIGAFMVIQGFVAWLFLPHLDDYIESKIKNHEDSKQFENKIFELADKYADSPNFKLMVINMQEEFKSHLEERLQQQRKKWNY